ncbi:hypothetical protein Q5H93_20595 [Hymenobacter sp. ASUV-10]|uniref:Uncharacterized protein n=1 Tax=Hymenobacter aranciens TaxID=3063996 RepID=A0ABT9BFY1_9BACT|nr:hypothetical protein [Hymenobacter sp. ASUV-10]MDO7877157.1 hypothetical protein [Hymenobacter sp. ASUV-10]
MAGAAVCGTNYTLSSSAIPLLTLTQGGAYTLPAGAGQPGQVLTQQAGGAVRFQDPQWTQNGAALYPSTPGSNIGIDTSTPNARLSISPTTTEPKLTLFDGGSRLAHYGLGVSGSQLNYHVLTSSDRHVFYAKGRNGDGTELLRIQGDGNVGIDMGGAAPGARLDVRGGVLAGGSNGVGAQGAHLQWNRSGGEGETWLINNLGLGNAAVSGIRFGGATTGSTTTVTEWARFLTNGNLGLGTTTPGARLEVAGQVKITGGAPGPGKVLTSDGSGLATWESVAGAAATNFVQNQTAAAQAASFRIGGSGRIDGENQGLLVDAGGAARVGLMKYAGHEAGLWRAAGQDFEIGRTDVSDLTTTPTTYTTDVYVDGTGNVGIGTGTAAAARLHVAGTAGTSNVRLESLGGTGTRLVTADASGNLGSSTSTAAFGNEFIRNSGTVQAGAVFNIGGGGVVGGSLTANGGLNVTGPTFINNTGTGTTLVGNSSSGAVSVTGSSVSLVSGVNSLSLNTSNNTLFGGANSISLLTPGGGALSMGSTGVNLSSPNGNLLIGTGNTIALGNANGTLNINGTSMSLSSARGMLNIGSNWSASSQGAISFISNAGTSFYSSGAFDILSTGGFTLNSSSGTTITAGPNSLTVLNNGVGVGTTAPTSTLHTTGTVAVGVTNGLAGSPSPGVALTATAYNGLSPSGTNSHYQLPNPTTCVGRVYYLRNNSSSEMATLHTAGGLLFDGGDATGVTGYGLSPSGSSKTVTVISDGTNWTVLRSGN